MEKKKIQGVIFDMDGLLVDTEKLYNRFWREAAHDYGCAFRAGGFQTATRPPKAMAASRRFGMVKPG